MEDVRDIHTDHLEMKTLHGINIRLDTAEGQISELEDTNVETIQNATHGGKNNQ